MKPDISDMSVEELRRLTAEAEALIESKKDEEIVAAYQAATAAAEKVGLTLDELVATANGGKRKKSKGPRKSVEPRYRNTDNPSDTWTGRGKKPRWLSAQIANGKALEDFLI